MTHSSPRRALLATAAVLALGAGPGEIGALAEAYVRGELEIEGELHDVMEVAAVLAGDPVQRGSAGAWWQRGLRLLASRWRHRPAQRCSGQRRPRPTRWRPGARPNRPDRPDRAQAQHRLNRTRRRRVQRGATRTGIRRRPKLRSSFGAKCPAMRVPQCGQPPCGSTSRQVSPVRHPPCVFSGPPQRSTQKLRSAGVGRPSRAPCSAPSSPNR